MLKKIVSAFVLVSVFFSGSTLANGTQNAELATLKDEVQKRVTVLRDDHNIIVTQSDENNIKKVIIVERLKADDSGASGQEKSDKAMVTYEVTDPVDQRDIIIMYGFGAGGVSPPK